MISTPRRIVIAVQVIAVFGAACSGGSESRKDTAAPVTTASPRGGVYASARLVTLDCVDEGGGTCAGTYFTLDGSETTTASTRYSGPIAITADAVLKFFSVDTAGNAEAVRSETYAFDASPPVTSVAPAGGTYGATQNAQLDCADAGPAGCAAIFYTLDGSEPTAASSLYTGPLAISSDTVLKFFSMDTAGNAEAVRTESYVIDLVAPVTSASPPGGRYASAQTVTLSCNDQGGTGCVATYYTLDGSDPTPASSAYAGPLTIAADAAMKYFSVDAVGHAGPVETETYVIDRTPPRVASVSPADGAEGAAATSIALTFDEAVDAATVSGATLIVRADGAPVAGTVGYAAATRMATFTFAGSFPRATVIEIEVTTGVKDLVGNAMAQPFLSRFTTAPPARFRLNPDTAAEHAGLQIAFDRNGNGMAVWLVGSGTAVKILYATYAASSGQWSPERVLVERLRPNAVTYQSLALASDGTGYVAIWRDTEPATGDVGLFYSAYAGGNWSAPAPVKTTSGWVSYGPRIASNGNGYAAMWQQYSSVSSAYRNHASFFRSGAWTTPEIIDDGAGSIDTYGGSGIAATGTRYAFVWAQYEGTVERIYARVHDGVAWEALAKIDSATGGSSNPTIARSSSGFGVAWQQGNGVAAARYYYDAAAARYVWSSPQTLSTGTAYVSFAGPRIASSTTGYAVTWPQGGYTLANVLTCTTACTWSGQQQLSSAPSSAYGPMIASDGASYLIAWNQNQTQMLARRYSAGTWGSAEVFANNVNAFGEAPLIHDGAKYAVFWAPYPTFGGYWFANRGATGTWTAPQRLPVGTYRGSATTPTVVRNGSGVTLAVWQQSVGSYWYAWARVHDAQGWGNPVQLSSAGVSPSAQPVAATNGTTFAAAWSNGRTQAAIFTPGTGWSATHDFGAGGWDLRIASNGSGYAVLWRAGNVLQWSQYTGAWSAVSDVVTAAGYAYDPHQLASNGSGYAVVWQDNDGTAYSAFARRYEGSAWSATEAVDASSSHVWEPRMVSNGAGYLAGWYDQSSGLWTRAYAQGAGGGAWAWQTPQLVANSGGPTTLEFVPDGSGYSGIWAAAGNVATSSYRAGGTGTWSWGAPTTLDNGAVSAPSLAAIGSTAFAAWVRVETAGARLYCARRAAGWGRAALAEDLSGDAYEPLATSLDGQRALVWTQDHPGDVTARDLWISAGY